MRLWKACLFCYIKELKSYVAFSSPSNQRKEIIFHITRIAILVERQFDSDSNILNSGNIRNVLLGNITEEDSELFKFSKTVTSSLRRIKELILGDSNYKLFEENIIKTWETHKIRDVKEFGKNIGVDEAIQTTENRGGFYFLALIFALNPNDLKKYEEMIYYCGAWFQITDDYVDRCKDVGIKNTPFTTKNGEASKTIFKKLAANYEEKIKGAHGKNSLIKFMRNLCALLLHNPF